MFSMAAHQMTRRQKRMILARGAFRSAFVRRGRPKSGGSHTRVGDERTRTSWVCRNPS